MEPQRWKQVEALYLSALEQEESRRREFLQKACRGDPELLQEVESLLAYEKPSDQFMESPAMHVAAKALAASEINPTHDLAPGQAVSHYRIVEKLGEGGMGVVYKAEDIRLGRSVAVKFLPPGLARDPQALDRFQREARAASALNHPHICTVHDIGDHEGQPFMVMELLVGHTLKELIQAGHRKGSWSRRSAPFAPDRLLDLALQIADALAAAHNHRIIHRDVKPANIFVTESGEAKLLDFGLAKLTPMPSRSTGPVLAAALPAARRAVAGPARRQDHPHDSAGMSKPGLAADPSQDPLSFTRPGMMMGTLSYMSPEQARNEELDVRTDLFSLGAVLYEMATGRQAFPGESAAEVMSALLTESPIAPSELNALVPPEMDRIISKALEKDLALRYQSAAELRADLKRLQRDTDSGRSPGVASVRSYGPKAHAKRQHLPKGWILTLAAAVLVGAAAMTAYFRLHGGPSHVLTAQDNIVLADFTNSTGEAVFDDTLRQALRVQLEQSPFLYALSDERVSQTLEYMGRPRDTRLNAATAREVCLRTGSKAMITSSIALLGSHYVLTLDAVNCATGDSLGTEMAEAGSRELVLQALGEAATKLRAKLGESLASIEKYDAPVERATTSSLEALQAYSLGAKKLASEGDAAAIPFFFRATETDPHFAVAFARLGNCYANLNEASRGMEPIRRAYELRGQVSEMERLLIEAYYYGRVTGEMEKAAQVYELWKQTYPRDVTPYLMLANIYQILGRYDAGLEESREALRLQPNTANSYSNLANTDLILNRVEDAKEVLARAQARGLNTPAMQVFLFRLAFLRNDQAAMERLVSAAAGQPAGDLLLAEQADAEAYYGHLAQARELTRRTADSALRDGRPEAAATFRAAAALREAAFGNRQRARREAAAALAMSPGQMVQTLAALALAWAGDPAAANKLVADLHKQSPFDTLLETYWLPTIRAAIALSRQAMPTSASPLALRGGAAAIELLEPVRPYELDLPTLFWALNVTMCPVEERGQSYLALGQGAEAAVEFKKIIHRPGLVGTFPIGALARLGLARAYALEARTATTGGSKHVMRPGVTSASGTGKQSSASEALAQARSAYQDFFALWRQADPDIPILKEAKSEYARLK